MFYNLESCFLADVNYCAAVWVVMNKVQMHLVELLNFFLISSG